MISSCPLCAETGNDEALCSRESFALIVHHFSQLNFERCDYIGITCFRKNGSNCSEMNRHAESG
jgi:hypothetical protein